jgi:D-lactate dehydrogenase
VLINTGDLVRRLRSESVGAVSRGVWNTAGKAWGPVTQVASLALSIASVVAAPLITVPNRAARAVVGKDALPLWSKDLPRGGRKRTSGTSGVAEAVYFQACVGTMFGPAEGGEGVAVAFQSLAEKAGIGLVRPEGIGGLCCGTPWKSKGILDGYHEMVARTADALWRASDRGRLPVVCDNSSCSEGLVLALEKAIEKHPEYQGMRIVDAVDFAAEHLFARVEVTPTIERMVVHPTCSSTRAGSNANLTTLASAVAAQVTVPVDWGCCAFAGDRGMLHPELTASATSRESSEVAAGDYDAYVSCNRTCEIGMTRATGHPYRHILEVLDAAASTAPTPPNTEGENHV